MAAGRMACRGRGSDRMSCVSALSVCWSVRLSFLQHFSLSFFSLLPHTVRRRFFPLLPSPLSSLLLLCSILTSLLIHHSPSPIPHSSMTSTPVLPADIAVAKGWAPDSWRTKPILQDVDYPDQAHLDRVLEKLARLPPMVVPGEVSSTRPEYQLRKKFILTTAMPDSSNSLRS